MKTRGADGASGPGTGAAERQTGQTHETAQIVFGVVESGGASMFCQNCGTRAFALATSFGRTVQDQVPHWTGGATAQRMLRFLPPTANPRYRINMGRGDKKTRKGKISRGSFGKSRPKAKNEKPARKPSK